MSAQAVTADILSGDGVAHGFFSRRGGVSTGLYDSLNCGPGSGDEAAHVAENRRRTAAALGLDALRTCYQIHGTRVVTVEDDATETRVEADALVSRARGIALGVLTADCAPVLFHDPAAAVIGAAHAGWRGALSGVVEETVAAMEALGAARNSLTAVVGPCIAQASYEVGPDFPEAFRDDDSFFEAGSRPGHWQFDLPGYVVARLARLGIGEAVALGHDTYDDEDRFFSYRRSCHRGEGDYGRCLSAIALV
jgi:polyphenol oxidase